jgi:hypothetical protein
MSGFQDFSVWLLTQQERKDDIGFFARDYARDIRIREQRGERQVNTFRGLESAVDWAAIAEERAGLVPDPEIPEAKKALKQAYAEWRRLLAWRRRNHKREKP